MIIQDGEGIKRNQVSLMESTQKISSLVKQLDFHSLNFGDNLRTRERKKLPQMMLLFYSIKFRLKSVHIVIILIRYSILFNIFIRRGNLRNFAGPLFFIAKD